MDRRLCAAAARARLDRGPHRRDRVSLGGGTQRALRRDRGRVRPAARSMSSSRREPHVPSPQSRRHRSSRSSSRWRATRSAPAWSQAWRDRAATSPACRSRRPILPASGSNCCARLSPVSAGWRSWPMSAIPPPCWRWARFRRQPARSASRSPRSKSGEREDIAPAFEALKGRAEALYVVRRPARDHQPDSHQHLGARRATADDVRVSGVRRSGRSDVLWTELPGPVPARRRLCRQDSARGEAGRHAGRAADQVRSGHQPEHRQGARPRPCRRRCSPAPTR